MSNMQWQAAYLKVELLAVPTVTRQEYFLLI